MGGGKFTVSSTLWLNRLHVCSFTPCWNTNQLPPAAAATNNNQRSACCPAAAAGRCVAGHSPPKQAAHVLLARVRLQPRHIQLALINLARRRAARADAGALAALRLHAQAALGAQAHDQAAPAAVNLRKQSSDEKDAQKSVSLLQQPEQQRLCNTSTTRSLQSKRAKAHTWWLSSASRAARAAMGSGMCTKPKPRDTPLPGSVMTAVWTTLGGAMQLCEC